MHGPFACATQSVDREREREREKRKTKTFRL